MVKTRGPAEWYVTVGEPGPRFKEVPDGNGGSSSLIVLVPLTINEHGLMVYYCPNYLQFCVFKTDFRAEDGVKVEYSYVQHYNLFASAMDARN